MWRVMVMFSKHQFQVVSHPSCYVLHPWTTSCIRNCVSTSLLGLQGGSKFFLLINIIQILLRREYQLPELIQTCRIFLRSCLLCGFSSGSSIGTMCLLRWLNGKYNIFCLGAIPGLVGGCGIFFEHPSRRRIDCTILLALFTEGQDSTILVVAAQLCLAYCAPSLTAHFTCRQTPDLFRTLRLFVQCRPVYRPLHHLLLGSVILKVANLYLKLFEDEGIINANLPVELFIFTISSSLLLYYLRKYNSSRSALWPFPAPRLAKNVEDRNHCSHKEPCLESIQKAGSTYFCYALALQVVKVVAYNINKLFKTPISFLKILFDPKQLRLPLFAGAYITLLKGVGCLLVKYRKRDEAWHILPAGVIASLSYLIQPNLSLALIAFSNLSQILCSELTSGFKLPSWPWQELLFILLMGLLFHARAAYPLLFPRYMAYIMDSATAGRAKTVYKLVEENLIVRL